MKVSIVGSLRDRVVACSASDRQGSNFESCVWRTISSQSSHHPQEVLLAQFSLYVHKGGLKPDSFHFPPPHSRWRLKNGFRGLYISVINNSPIYIVGLINDNKYIGVFDWHSLNRDIMWSLARRGLIELSGIAPY